MKRLLALSLLLGAPLAQGEEIPEAGSPWVYKEAAPAPPPAASDPAPAAPDASSERQAIGKPSAEERAFLGPQALGASPSPSWWKTAAAFAVTGLLLGAGVMLLKRLFPSRLSGKPSGLMEVLGRTPVGPKQSVVLLRVAGRVLVVGVGPESMHALAEIGNPEEVEKLLLKELKPPSEDFRARLTGVLSPFRGAPMGAFGGAGADALEGEIRSLERRVASWRVEEERTGPG